MRTFFCGVVALLFFSVPPARAESPAPARPAVIEVDTSDAPDLADFGAKVKEVAEKWYPIIIEQLPGDGFTPPDHVTITFRKDYKGVAATGGDKIVASVDYFRRHKDDLGAFVHELTHVVQAYHHGKVPGWITEGIADYVRFFNYEPQSHRPHPKADKATYHDSYRTSAAFLNWAALTYDKKLVVKLNETCRQGKYSDDWWKAATGKSLEELGDAWKESLAKAEKPQ